MLYIVLKSGINKLTSIYLKGGFEQT